MFRLYCPRQRYPVKSGIPGILRAPLEEACKNGESPWRDRIIKVAGEVRRGANARGDVNFTRGGARRSLPVAAGITREETSRLSIVCWKHFAFNKSECFGIPAALGGSRPVAESPLARFLGGDAEICLPVIPAPPPYFCFPDYFGGYCEEVQMGNIIALSQAGLRLGSRALR